MRRQPEVDHHKTLGCRQRLIEVLLGQVDRLGHFVIPCTPTSAVPVGATITVS